MDKVTKTLTVKQEEDGWWVASTPALDRDGDVVEPLGLELVNWQAAGSPIIWGHDYRSYWSTIGQAPDARVSNKGFELKPQWRDPANESDPMTVIRALIDAGLIRQLSIGFKPIEFEEIDTGYRFTRAEILEVSAVNVAANQEALRLAVKGMGDDPEGTEHVKVPCEFCGDETQYSHTLALETLLYKRPIACDRCVSVAARLMGAGMSNPHIEYDYLETLDGTSNIYITSNLSTTGDGGEPEEGKHLSDDATAERDEPDEGQATPPDDAHLDADTNTEPDYDEDAIAEALTPLVEALGELIS